MNIRTLEKHADGDEVFQFTFTKHSAILAGQTIASITDITATPVKYEEGVVPDAITISSKVVNAAGTKVQARYSGGTSRVTYEIECHCLTNQAVPIVKHGLLYVN